MDAILKIEGERDLIAELRKAAEQIAAEGHAGWGNTCLDAAQTLAGKDAEIARLTAQRDELLAALGDLSFECDGVFGYCERPTVATYNRTFEVLIKNRAALTQPTEQP